MSKIKAIIFDMDGVLIDARDWHYEALNRALGLFGFKISEESHLSSFDGLPTKKKLQMLSKRSGLPERLHTLINDLKQIYTRELAVQFCKPTFVHRHVLTTLKDEGFVLAVCSNSIQSSVELMLTNAGIVNFFEFYLSNEDVRAAKPNPEIYKKAIEQLGVSPSETLIIEDNEHGVQAATESGAHVLRVSDPEQVCYQNIYAKLESIQLQGKF